MKFSCERYLLLAAVNTAGRCTASKSPIPALEGLLIEAGADVKITGYDLKKGIYTHFPADVSEPGAIVLGAKIFGEIVRSLPDGVVTISSGENYAVTIRCGASVFNIIGSDAEEYPELPTVDTQNSVGLPQKLLGQMIRQTIFAVSDNESRPVYTGALFEVEGNTLSVVAVDGYRLALRRENVEGEGLESCRFIVPGTALNDLEKLCADTDDKVDITVGAKHISFVVGDTVLISRRLEGEFLNYKKSIPQEFNIRVKIERSELLRVVSRVSLIIDEKIKNPLRLTFGDGELALTCATGVGKADDRCPITGDGKGLEIGFNNRYLLDALKAAPAEELTLCLNTDSSPCVIRAADGSDAFSYMILPVRLKAGA